MLLRLQIPPHSIDTRPNLSRAQRLLVVMRIQGDLYMIIHAEWERRCNFRNHTLALGWRLVEGQVALLLCHKLSRELKDSLCLSAKILVSRASLDECSPVLEVVLVRLHLRVGAHCYKTDTPFRRTLNPETL
jgi:hypothetical protein